MTVSSGEADHGSFRDPHSRVLTRDGAVLRALSSEGLADYRALVASGLSTDRRVVGTTLTNAVVDDALLPGGVAAVLEHDRVPFISYPFEWTFSMLRDAALLQLDLMVAALEQDLTLKDASPYNVQFRGAEALFIDVGSFEQLREEELWVGYRQFCMLYLYPLLLQAAKGARFQPWLRGSLDGIRPGDMRAMCSRRDAFRRGFPTHVFLYARLDRRTGLDHPRIAGRLRRPGLGKQIITANLRKMRRLVSRLHWDPPRGVWTSYGAENSYTDADASRKDEFVKAACTERRPRLVWDVGCNTGRHSRIAADVAAHVVAFDSDHGSVELLYRELRTVADGRILPLVIDAADPSPGLGWRNRERATLIERGRPDLVLALAVVHHLAITNNVPLREVVRWLADLGGAVVVEFPTREDPMVQQMLRGKRDGLHGDYDRGCFERWLGESFDVRRQVELASGTRVLYDATPRRQRGADL